MSVNGKMANKTVKVPTKLQMAKRKEVSGKTGREFVGFEIFYIYYFLITQENFGFIRKKLQNQAIDESTENTIIGVGSLNSANNGATIVAVRAKMLQIPKVVAEI